MLEISERMRSLLKKAFKKRGGVIKNMDFFKKKRPTIYFWLNGKTKTVDEYIFILMMHFVKPYMTYEDHLELDPIEKGARMMLVINTPVKSDTKQDSSLEAIQNIWGELTEIDKQEILAEILNRVAVNSKIRHDAERENAYGEYLREKYEAEQLEKQEIEKYKLKSNEQSDGVNV